VLPKIRELRVIHTHVFVAECGKHELSLERAVQQIGQIPQTLQTLLDVHADGVRQRVTATSSYSLVSPRLHRMRDVGDYSASASDYR